MAHWIFVDYENVRPSDFSPDRQPDTHVLVFLGASQQKIPSELAIALQAFGAKGHYVRCSASGKNALDFHIAFYLGEIAPQHPDDRFHLISADTGFDPLVKHMRGKRGIAVTRHTTLPPIPGGAGNARAKDKSPARKKAPAKKQAPAKTDAPSVEDVRLALAGAGSTRPRKVNTLRNWIDARFNGKLDERQLDRLVAGLRSRRLILVNGDKVSYRL